MYKVYEKLSNGYEHLVYENEDENKCKYFVDFQKNNTSNELIIKNDN